MEDLNSKYPAKVFNHDESNFYIFHEEASAPMPMTSIHMNFLIWNMKIYFERSAVAWHWMATDYPSTPTHHPVKNPYSSCQQSFVTFEISILELTQCKSKMQEGCTVSSIVLLLTLIGPEMVFISIRISL